MTAVAVPIPKTTVVRIFGRPIYALQPKQLEVFALTPVARPDDWPYAQHIACGGAAGGGKSYLSRVVFTAVALGWPGSTSILFRRTEREVKENHINKFLAEVPQVIERKRVYSFNASDLVVTWYTGSRTYFGYLKQDNDVFTYQGPEYDHMNFEESTHYSDFQVRYLTGNRLRATTPLSRPFAMYPSNPGNRGHFWYKRLFIDRRFRPDAGERPENYAFVQMFLRDNMELMQRDPGYAARLDQLPEPWRSWQRDGNFAAGAGTALPDLDRNVHLIPAFEIPPHWSRFGAFDWGYNHPFSFGEYAVNEDGVLFKLQTITGRHMQDRDIADRITSHLDATRLPMIHAGHDCWADIKARGENAPTTAETFAAWRLYLVQANISRVSGLKQMRGMLNPRQPGGAQFFLLDNDGNRRCFEQLESRVPDPDDPEDVLKTDADEFGEGGDDIYDETRYALASRPTRPEARDTSEALSAWSPEVLKAEYERNYRGRGDKPLQTDPYLGESEFGDF